MSKGHAERNKARLALVIAGALTALALTGCGTPRRSEPIAGAFEPDDPATKRGRLAFDRHCHTCHVGGEGGMAPSINEKPLPKALMRLQIRVGLGAMPAFSESELSDQGVDDIVEYLAALRKHGK